MTEQEYLEIVTAFVTRAEKRDFTEPHFICSVAERNYIKLDYVKLGILTKVFKKAATASFKTYTKACETGDGDFELLAAYITLQDCLDFFKLERAILRDMLEEYYEYVLDGHIFDFLAGNDRSEEDLYDRRPKKGQRGNSSRDK